MFKKMLYAVQDIGFVYVVISALFACCWTRVDP